MTIAIRDVDVRRDIDFLLDDHLFVHRNEDVVSDIASVFDYQRGIVKDAPASDTQVPIQVHVVTYVDLCVSCDVRHQPEMQVLAHGSATTPESRFTVEIVQQPAEAKFDREVKIVDRTVYRPHE